MDLIYTTPVPGAVDINAVSCTFIDRRTSVMDIEPFVTSQYNNAIKVAVRNMSNYVLTLNCTKREFKKAYLSQINYRRANADIIERFCLEPTFTSSFITASHDVLKIILSGIDDIKIRIVCRAFYATTVGVKYTQPISLDTYVYK